MTPTHPVRRSLPSFAQLASLGRTVGGSAGSIALRGFSIASNIAAVSLALRLLGPERYGQFVLLMAGAGWLALGMLGTAEYFTQALVKFPGGVHDAKALPLLRANLLYCLMGAGGSAVIGVAALLVLSLVMPLEPAVIAAGIILLAGMAVSQPLSMASSALVAQGRIGFDAVFKLLQPLSFLAMVLAAYLLPAISSATMLIVLSAAYGLSWLVTRAWAFLVTFEIKPLLRGLLSAHVGPVAKGAWPFLVIQLAALLSFQTDRFLVSSFSSLGELASYDLLFRIFGALYAVFSIPLLHIWRLVGTSWHAADMARLKRVVLLYAAGSAGFWIAATIAAIILAPYAIALFSGGSVAALPVLVTVLIGAFFLIRGTTDVLTLSLYAMEQEKTLLPFVIAHGVTNVALAALGGALGGIRGLLVGQIVSFILSTLLPFAYLLRRQLRRAGAA